jgi:hypothetical protein
MGMLSRSEIEDTETTFAIGWKGQYRIEGAAFVYIDGDTRRTTAILGYPTHKLSPRGQSQSTGSGQGQ